MDTVHSYKVSSRWMYDRSGIVSCETDPTSVRFSAPAEFQGEAGRWTPEHFLLAAVATCFITTFRAISDFSKFASESLEVEVEGKLGKGERGIAITEITVRPVLEITDAADEVRAVKLLHKAESACFISHSLRSGITLEPQVKVLTTA